MSNATTDAWADFLVALHDCSELLRQAAPDETTTEEAAAYLARLTASILEEALDPSQRTIGGIYYSGMRIAGKNPDYRMGAARIDPAGRYRVSGRLNDSARLGLGLYSVQPDAGLQLDDYHVVWTAVGHDFDLTIGGDDSLLVPRSTTALLMTRELRLHGQGIPADLRLERLDRADSVSEIPVALALAAAAGRLRALVSQFLRWSEVIALSVNHLSVMPPELDDIVRGDPETFYFTGHFDLQEDEALMIGVPETDAPYWMFQATNYWLEPIAGANCNNATSDKASRTIYVGPLDPGCSNWLDTRGCSRGQLLARFVGGSAQVVPLVRRITLC